MAHPMGESKPRSVKVGFDRRLKLEFRGSQISSDGSLLPYRDLEEALGLSALAGSLLSEARRGKNTRHLGNVGLLVSLCLTILSILIEMV